MSAADVTGALTAYLRTTAVNGLVAGRIVRPELTPDLIAAMPRATVVVRRAGGYQLTGSMNAPIGDPFLDVFCYSDEWMGADAIAAEVVLALRSLRTATHHSTRLMSARIAGGPNPYVNPSEQWPCLVVTAQVICCELALT